MKAEIIAIGRELLMGEITDTNTPFIARELAKVGFTVERTSHVGDNLEHLSGTMQSALSRTDLVLTCGGLGPTSDDITREAAAKVMGETPHIDDTLLEELKGIFIKRGFKSMPETNVKQAWLIPSAKPLRNSLGTAPGWWIDIDDSHLVLLPGPPREMQSMWHESLADKLEAIGKGQRIAVRTLKTFGLTEGRVDEILSDLFGFENPYLGIYARRDGIHLRVIARAELRAEAEEMAEKVKQEVESRLNDWIWGRDGDSVAQSAVSALSNKRFTLGVIELASCGFVSSMMTEAGAGPTFKGSIVVNPDILEQADTSSRQFSDIKKELLTREGDDAVLHLALVAKEITGASVGLTVMESGPNDQPTAKTVRIGIVSGSDKYVAQNPFARGRVYAPERAAFFALIELIGWLQRTKQT